MTNTRQTIALLLVALPLVACVGATPTPLPYNLKESARLNWKGGKAMSYGDYGRALTLSQAAYHRALSIDRVDEAVDELIIQGVILRKLDRRKEAMRVVTTGWELIADDRAMGYKPAVQSDYDDEAIRLAIIGTDLALDANDIPTAEIWLKRGEMTCGGCYDRGAFLNLRARMKKSLGSPVEAGALANDALAANRKAGNRLEEGHSLRLLGQWEDNPATARDHFMKALTIDRALAVPSLIVDDLIGVGEATLRLGDEQGASRYLRRAKAIAHAYGDEKRSARVDAILQPTSPLPE